MKTKRATLTSSFLVALLLGACGVDAPQGCASGAGSSANKCQGNPSTGNLSQSAKQSSSDISSQKEIERLTKALEELKKATGNKDSAEISQLKEQLANLKNATGSRESPEIRELKEQLESLKGANTQQVADAESGSSSEQKKKKNKKKKKKEKDNNGPSQNPLEKIGNQILSSAGDVIGKAVSGGLSNILGGGKKTQTASNLNQDDESIPNTQTPTYGLSDQISIDTGIAFNPETDL